MVGAHKRVTKASFAAAARRLGIKKTHRLKSGKLGYTQAQVKRIFKAAQKGGSHAGSHAVMVVMQSRSRKASRPKSNPKRRVRNIAKKRRRRRGLTIAGFAKKVILPAAPHLISNAGVAGMGYNLFDSGISLGERIQRLGVNELMLFTGYDAKGKRFNATPMLVNYGALIIPKMATKIARMLRG